VRVGGAVGEAVGVEVGEASSSGGVGVSQSATSVETAANFSAGVAVSTGGTLVGRNSTRRIANKTGAATRNALRNQVTNRNHGEVAMKLPH
jgi:hypothetical protein